MNRRVNQRQDLLHTAWGLFQLLLVCAAAVGSGLFAYRFVREQQYLVVKEVVVEGAGKYAFEYMTGGIGVSPVIVMEWLAFISLNLWILLTAWGMRLAPEES